MRRGINFVGYRTWASKRFIRKHSIFKFRRAVLKGKFESVVSTFGHARHTHSLQHLIRYLQEKNHDLYRKIPKVYKLRTYY